MQQNENKREADCLDDRKLSHTDEAGNVNMVDVSSKPDSLRTAHAYGKIQLHAQTCRLIREDGLKKGNVLTTAEIAGITAAKKCWDLIPLCHNIPLTKVDVKMTLGEDYVEARTMARCIGHTGVEMEALTAASVALLTVYDMCKAVDKEMEIVCVKLIDKTKERLQEKTPIE